MIVSGARTVVEIRNQKGEFVGVFDGVAERRGLDLRLPVRSEINAFYEPSNQPLTRLEFQIVSLEWVQWWDTKRIDWILKASPSDEALLSRASHVIVRGATSSTWLDRELKYREAIQRVVWMLILLKLPTTGTKH